MNNPVLNAVARVETTKGELNQLRKAGKIPAVVYGGGQAAVHILLDEKEFLKATAGISESTIISMDIDGKKSRAFVKARQRNTLTNRIIHIDFLEVVSGRMLTAKVPVHLVGAPVGVREGGILENPAHEIMVECDPDHLPEKIDIDVSELHANHSIHVRDIPAMDKVKILSSSDLVVAVVKYAKAEAVATPVAEAAAAPGAAPAAGAPGAAPAPAAAGAAAPAAEKKAEKK
ncbi:MAG TPA: 50S ribosomal protein L25 [Rectinemataceae bacterium]|nr:50S ribosomal protein L25 [Rectinemataceae bacterium]